MRLTIAKRGTHARTHVSGKSKILKLFRLWCKVDFLMQGQGQVLKDSADEACQSSNGNCGAAVEGVRWSRFTYMLYRTNRATPDTVSPISLMLKQMREASAAAAAAAASSHSGHCVGVQLSGRLQLQNC
jgi:hypothetical protein